MDEVTGDGPFVIYKDTYVAEVDKDGNITDSYESGPRAKVENKKIVNNADGTGDNLAKASVDSTTTPTIYISFTTSIENGTITGVTCDNSVTPVLTGGIWVTPVTTNGSYSFTITGTVNGENKTRTYQVTVDQFSIPLKVGTYVNYGVTYKDMYTDNDFTADNGWRILDLGTDNGDGTYSGVKLISTGIPVGLYYYYSDIADAPWAGTGTNYNDKAANGLLNNFRSIVFNRVDTTSTHNRGYYKSIDGQTDGDLDTSKFIKVTGATVHNLTLEEINKARGISTLTDTTSTATKDGAKGLFYLRNLGKYGYSSSISPYYWLASPNSGTTTNLWRVFYDGTIDSYDYSTYGVRLVVNLPDNSKLTVIEN